MRSVRLNILQIIFTLIGIIIGARFFYWQILSADKLKAIAEAQHSSTIEIPSSRGKILSSDGYPLVANQLSYFLYAYLPDVIQDKKDISEKLSPLLVPTPEEVKAIPSAKVREALKLDAYTTLLEKLNHQDLAWIPIKRNITPETKGKIDAFGIEGLGFEQGQIRYYPEASMAAQLTGFVGSDATGAPTGYFGLEGFYDLELRGKSGFIRQEKDAAGKPIVIGSYQDVSSRDGRDIMTHLDRGIQLLVEQKLNLALKRYGAISGEVIIMDPKTGGILALASLPTYEQSVYKNYDSYLYKLPSISDTYEPGSTFKVIVVSAALEEDVVEEDTPCDDNCTGPVTIGKFTIRTWNNEYFPGQTVREIIERSDNTGMIFVAQSLGKEKFVEYIKRFGIGETTDIDIEGEVTPDIRKRWGDIDLATGSFGQGLAVTSIQMLRAVGAIANDGKLMEPHVVKQVIGERPIGIQPKVVRQVISKDTADRVTDLMVSAVESGEASWVTLKGYRVAGKTGTSQIPISGHYDEDKTIASFVGFAPADDPKFVMLVKLREPESSPWAAETAAPLWMDIAKELFFYLNIPPTSN